MKKYNSDEVFRMTTIENPSDFRTHRPDSFGQFFKLAFIHIWSNNKIRVSALILLLIVLPFFALVPGHFIKSMISWIIAVCYSVNIVRTYHTLYKSLAEAYYRFDKYGISLMIEDDRMVRFSTDDWKLVEEIYEYSDFIVVTLSEQSESASQIFISGSDKESALNNLFAFWKPILNGKKPEEMPDLYSVEEMAEVEDFIEAQFGNIYAIGHEDIKGLDMHIDLAIIEPTEERPYFTICTIGAGAYRMSLDYENRVTSGVPEYNEYCIHLPKDWIVYEEGWDKEENWWPIRLLKTVAKAAKNNGSWYLCSDIVSFDSISDEAKAKSVFIDFPLPDPTFSIMCDTTTGRTINFLQIIPISEEEAYHFDGREEEADYTEKNSYIYGFDTNSEVTDEEQRAKLYIEHTIGHFKKLVNSNI